MIQWSIFLLVANVELYMIIQYAGALKTVQALKSQGNNNNNNNNNNNLLSLH